METTSIEDPHTFDTCGRGWSRWLEQGSVGDNTDASASGVINKVVVVVLSNTDAGAGVINKVVVVVLRNTDAGAGGVIHKVVVVLRKTDAGAGGVIHKVVVV